MVDPVTDYYLVLGLTKTATPAEIDAAFRRLARKYHPDTRPLEENALALFKSAREAHEVLSDKEKRLEYDRQQRAKRRPRQEPSRRAAYPPRRADPSRTPSPTRDSALDVRVELPLLPEEALRGGPVEVRISLRESCPSCPGAGGTADVCPSCQGEGTIWESRLVELWLPPGLGEGSVICLTSGGRQADPHGLRGDLYLKVRIRPCW